MQSGQRPRAGSAIDSSRPQPVRRSRRFEQLQRDAQVARGTNALPHRHLSDFRDKTPAPLLDLTTCSDERIFDCEVGVTTHWNRVERLSSPARVSVRPGLECPGDADGSAGRGSAGQRMGRVYGEPTEVQTREDGHRPARFVWRGRLYAVRSVLEHWVVNREWWQ